MPAAGQAAERGRTLVPPGEQPAEAFVFELQAGVQFHCHLSSLSAARKTQSTGHLYLSYMGLPA